MKTTLILFALPLALLCAADKKTARKKAPATTQQAAKPAAPAAPTAPTAPSAPTIPAGAVKTAPNTYSYTSADGVKWTYRETPFGVVKIEDKPVAAQPVMEDKNPTVITDLGESVKFTRQTPFGAQSWTKKKADLSDDEKAQVSKSEKP